MYCGSGTTFESRPMVPEPRRPADRYRDLALSREFRPRAPRSRVSGAGCDAVGLVCFGTQIDQRACGTSASAVCCAGSRWTLARQVSFRNSLAAKPRFLRKAIRRAKISQIYLNHYFTYEYAREFIGNQPFFLDTHDIQTVNFIDHSLKNAITGRVDRFENLCVMRWKSRGKHNGYALFRLQSLILRPAISIAIDLMFVLPLPAVVPCRPRPLAKAARSLIVASDNQGNLRNLQWFFQHVWPAVLRLCEHHLPPAAGVRRYSLYYEGCEPAWG